MPKSPEEMAASMYKNIEPKTGKSLAAWLALIAKSGPEKHREITNWLKKEHGVTHGYASLIAREHVNKGKAAPSEDDLVGAQYAGAKADLKPIYLAVLEATAKFGKGREVAPKKTYVSLRHKTQFALVQASTKTRVDIGIKLKGVAPTERLEDGVKWNAMITHRVRVTDASEIDAELVGWLKAAFDAAG